MCRKSVVFLRKLPDISTSPSLRTWNRDTLPSMKLMEPAEAMLLIRYSCEELLNPWNWASAPFWS